MASNLSTLAGTAGDPTFIYVSKAVANQVAYTTEDENLYFASMTGSVISAVSTVTLGVSGWAVTGLLALEPVSKLMIFYEYEGTYYIVDELAGHAKVNVPTGLRYKMATYMVGYQFTIAIPYLSGVKATLTSLNITDLLPCDTSCNTCNGGLSANDCSSCAPPNYLNKVAGSCGLVCPNGTW